MSHESKPLSSPQIQEALTKLPDWTHEHECLKKSFVFKDFKEALSFIVRLGLHAEEQGHHPEIVNVYNKVTLSLNTHDAGGQVTGKDVALAQTIEKFQWTGH